MASNRQAIITLKSIILISFPSAACARDAEIDDKAIKPKESISTLLFKADLVASVKKLLELLDPVAKLTNYCQKSTCSAADAAEEWLKLLENGPTELRDFVESRMKKSNVLNIVTMTSNYFHPIYRGKKLSEEQQKEVKSYLFDKLNEKQLESLRKFTKGEEVFNSMKQKNISSPITFWHYAAELGHEELAAFAMDYLKIPASTAQLERLFSIWAFIHNDTRNRLSDETSKKLINVYFTLRSNDENADEEFDIDDDELLKMIEVELEKTD